MVEVNGYLEKITKMEVTYAKHIAELDRIKDKALKTQVLSHQL